MLLIFFFFSQTEARGTSPRGSSSPAESSLKSSVDKVNSDFSGGTEEKIERSKNSTFDC